MNNEKGKMKNGKMAVDRAKKADNDILHFSFFICIRVNAHGDSHPFPLKEKVEKKIREETLAFLPFHFSFFIRLTNAKRAFPPYIGYETTYQEAIAHLMAPGLRRGTPNGTPGIQG
jgi:hypothetical protein